MGRPASERIKNPPREAFEKTGLSYAIAAEEINVPRGTLYEFVVNGIVPRMARYANLPKRFDDWLESAKKTRGRVKDAPLARVAFRRGIKEKELADLSGINSRVLWHGLHTGVWPDLKTKKAAENTIQTIVDRREEKKMITKVSLSEEVLEHWALTRDPFTNEMEESDDILETRDLARAEKKIIVAVEKNGWLAITGPVGSGKSTLLKKVEGRLAKRKDVVIVKPRTVEKQYLGASGICDAILEDLGVTWSKSHRLEIRARYVGSHLEDAFRDGKKIVLLIDEAHLLTKDALLALKRFYEFEVGFKKLLAIVLVGQAALARRLKSDYELAEVSQRVDLYEMGSLNGAMGSYLRHKLERAGCTKEIFEPAALKAMSRKVDTPLAVNNLAAAALIAGQDLGEKQITTQIIEAVQGGN
jgi:type II secretory pathway predicted ATPase ExeA